MTRRNAAIGRRYRTPYLHGYAFDVYVMPSILIAGKIAICSVAAAVEFRLIISGFVFGQQILNA